MEIYLTDVTDPVAFINRRLAELFHAKENPEKDALPYGGMVNGEVFQQFRNRFNHVSITCGLPHNDYGQTVRLSKLDALPNVAELRWMNIPPHLIGEALPLKPNEMTGRYGYRKVEDSRGTIPSVDEFFFFEFQHGYSPTTFAKFNSSLSALRYCSQILHTLDRFDVVLMENGVYVNLRARIDDSYKPSFAMNN